MKEKDLELFKQKNKCEKLQNNITNVESTGKKISEKTKGVISEVKILNNKVEKLQNKNQDLKEEVLRINSEKFKNLKDFELLKKEFSKKNHELKLKDKRLFS